MRIDSSRLQSALSMPRAPRSASLLFTWSLAAALVLAPSDAVARTLPEVSAALDPLVDQRAVSGMVTIVMLDGKVVHEQARGQLDMDRPERMRMNTIFRAFSMTKPVTAVAMMILRDEGKWRPEDPISKFLPELADLKVFKGLDSAGMPVFERPVSPPTVGQLLTHTAGFEYGFRPGYVNDQYRSINPLGASSTLGFIQRLSLLPLSYEPGSEWQYSLSMDIQGAIVERLSGQSLAIFMKSKIFGPLRMKDTGFSVPPSQRARLASLYTFDGKQVVRMDRAVVGGLDIFKGDFLVQPEFQSGGAGLVTTAPDYARFAQMLLNGGKIGGTRIISRQAAAEMMSNHLPAELSSRHFGIGRQIIRPGYAFGYNGIVVTDPGLAGVALGRGTYLWDGAAGTWFWIDPTNRVVFVGMIQRIMAAGGMPDQEAISQAAVAAFLTRSGRNP